MSLEIFATWLREHGASFAKLRLCESQYGGFGAIVTEPCRTDEAVLSVPSVLLMSVSAARKSEIKDQIASLHVLGLETKEEEQAVSEFWFIF